MSFNTIVIYGVWGSMVVMGVVACWIMGRDYGLWGPRRVRKVRRSRDESERPQRAQASAGSERKADDVPDEQ